MSKMDNELLENFSKSFSDSLSKDLLHAVDFCVKEAKQTAEDKINVLVDQTKERLDTLENCRPVLHISVGEIEPKKLSKRKSATLEMLLLNAKLGIYTLLIGPAGCGKTTQAQQVAEALDLQFGSLCLTAGASETWLFGRQTPNGFVEGSFSKLYREGGVFLADEMDAADANLLLSINTALSHNTMFNPMSGETIEKNENFVFIGAANTNGKGATHMYTGRSRLDAATLDRFNIIHCDYDKDLERELCDDKLFVRLLHQVREEIVRQGFEEFVSTRFFDKADKMLKANVDPHDVLKTLVANWSDSTRRIALKYYDNSYEGSLDNKTKCDLRKKRANKEFFGGKVQWKRV